MSPLNGKTSERGKRVVENIHSVDDPMILLFGSDRMWPSDSLVDPPMQKFGQMSRRLRGRPRSNRVRRYRLIIDQPGLKVFLLLAQPAASHQGTQLIARAPRRADPIAATSCFACKSTQSAAVR